MTINHQKNNNMTSADTVLPNQSNKKLDQICSYLPFGFCKNKPVIAILRLDGVIGKTGRLKNGLTIQALNKLIEKAFAFSSLKAVCLVINSPGGSPVQSEFITSRIRQLSDKNNVPIYSFIEDVAASGGYWLACAGDKIYASKSSIIGSIGVISSGFGFHQAIDKIGIERRVYTQGKTKSVLDPFKPVKDSDVKVINKIQQEIHNNFIDFIKTSRRNKLTQDDDVLFNGEFWSGQIALDYGLIDGIDNLYSFIQNTFGREVKIEYIETKQSWFKKKFGINTLAQELSYNLANEIVDSVEAKISHSKFRLD